MIGVGEVTGHRVELLELLVAMEFSAIIKRDCSEVFLVFANRFNTRLIYFFDGSGFDLLYNKEASFPLDERDDAMVTIAAYHRIAFPVADARSVFNFKRPVLDHAFTL